MNNYDSDKVASISERIKEGLRLKGYKPVDLSRTTGLSKSKISLYMNGHVEPKEDGLKLIADALGVSEPWLLGYDLPRLKVNNRRYSKAVAKVMLFDTPVSAGTGSPLLEGCEYTWYESNNIPSSVDFALYVRGDSMSPVYNDNDIVFIKQNVIVESGSVGVFILNGEGYLKMIQGNKLISLNPVYEPIVINESDSFMIVGKVISKEVK